MTKLSTVGEELVRLLHAHGVDTVFGIPGVHTVPLYRGLANGPIRHITPRHEQAAAFMADGLARVSGQPGVCFLITGPGLTNAATAMAQAYADSVPMLVITSVNPARSPEKGEGRLHELPDQSAFARTVAASTHNLESASELPGILAQIFSQFRSKRPRPIHLQISTDLLATQCSVLRAVEPAISTPVASASDIEIAATLLDDALRPLIIAGGGSQHADAILGEVAERLDAPVVTTLAAKGVIADQHALCVGAGLGHEHVRDEIREADVVLVVGSELAPTDLWPHISISSRVRILRWSVTALRCCRLCKRIYSANRLRIVRVQNGPGACGKMLNTTTGLNAGWYPCANAWRTTRFSARIRHKSSIRRERPFQCTNRVNGSLL